MDLNWKRSKTSSVGHRRSKIPTAVMRNAALCLLLTWQGESSSCHDKTMWCVSPSINNNPRFNATCSFELDELTRLCKASPALTHQSASCCPMQPDDSVEALSVYSTASALQREGAPECDDFQWLRTTLNEFEWHWMTLNDFELLWVTLIPQDSFSRPLLFYLENLTFKRNQSNPSSNIVKLFETISSWLSLKNLAIV